MVGKFGKSLLHLSIANYLSLSFVVGEYIKLGWDINCLDASGCTPLARAAEKVDLFDFSLAFSRCYL
jgi:hypothetical protein